jgi:hypothetical protein
VRSQCSGTHLRWAAARGRCRVDSGVSCAIGVDALMRFIETPIFTASVRKHLEDEAYRALRLALVLRPEQGALFRGGEGLRKLAGAPKGAASVVVCGRSTIGRSRMMSASSCLCSRRTSKRI